MRFDGPYRSRGAVISSHGIGGGRYGRYAGLSGENVAVDRDGEESVSGLSVISDCDVAAADRTRRRVGRRTTDWRPRSENCLVAERVGLGGPSLPFSGRLRELRRMGTGNGGAMLEPVLPLSRLGSLGLRARGFWCAAVPLEIMANLRMPGWRILVIPDRWEARERPILGGLDSGEDSCSSISGRGMPSKLGLDFEVMSLPRLTVYAAKGRLRSSSSVKTSRSPCGPSSSLLFSKPAKRLLERRGRRILDKVSSESGPLSLLPGYACT